MIHAARALAGLFMLVTAVAPTSVALQAESALDTFAWQPGDLLFLDLPCRLCDALESTSRRQVGGLGPRVSHVALIAREDDVWVVYEALPGNGVVRTPLRDVWSRREPFGPVENAHVARLRAEYQRLVPAALKEAARRLGTPFDPDYRRHDGRLTSGEFIVEVMQPASGGRSPFDHHPMYFGEAGVDDPDYEVWRADFARRGQTVPTSQPGVFPLRLYLASSVERLR